MPHLTRFEWEAVNISTVDVLVLQINVIKLTTSHYWIARLITPYQIDKQWIITGLTLIPTSSLTHGSHIHQLTEI